MVLFSARRIEPSTGELLTTVGSKELLELLTEVNRISLLRRELELIQTLVIEKSLWTTLDNASAIKLALLEVY